MDKLYKYYGGLLDLGSSRDLNCKIIAHRGYHADVAQNTIAAFVAAIENGFKWLEIDVRKTADGIYVMSHDNAVTMYNNGVSVAVNIANSNYSNIKTYTWDAEGKYKLCTLQAVFNAMKVYDVWMIVDLKSGSNKEVMEIATLSGANDRVMITYKAADSIDLYKKYDSVPIRIYASNYSKILELQESTVNPLYADFNTQGDYQAIPKALAAGIPMIFSGCTLDNKAIWQVLASGVMANLDLNISFDDFYNALNVDYDVVATITPSAQSVSISVSGTTSITATSNVLTPGGYVYGYTLDPQIATVVQETWGANVSFTITGVSAGQTMLRLFTGSGELIDIPVSVE